MIGKLYRLRKAIPVTMRSNPGLRIHFFKMLMKADTNVAFGEEVILLEAAEPDIRVTPSPAAFDADGGDVEVTVDATEDYRVTGAPAWATVKKTATGLLITAAENAGDVRDAVLTLTLTENTAVSASLTLQQAGATEQS
jgi:hypothetical protein